jgi:hypothetical protein
MVHSFEEEWLNWIYTRSTTSEPSHNLEDALPNTIDNGRHPREWMSRTSWNLGNIFKDKKKVLVARYV